MLHIPISLKTCVCCLVLTSILIQNTTANSETENSKHIGEDEIVSRYQIAKINFPRVSDAFSITLWIYLGILTKLGL